MPHAPTTPHPPPLHELGSVPAALAWLARRGVRSLVTDSRRVAAADACAFVAWPGYAHDARQFVAAALRDGAAACIVEADGVQALQLPRDERIAVMRGLKAQTGPLASGFFGAPSDRLKVVAVTGTNGKTSTAWWTAQALTALGLRCGVVGTLGIGEPPAVLRRPDGELPAAARGPQSEPAADVNQPARAQPAATAPSGLTSTGLTTPDPVTLHAGFRRMADAGFAACALEASSHGLEEHRLSGTHIDVASFTNLTQDHLDYHGSMAAYGQAKARLFSWPGLRAAVLNVDDAFGAALAGTLARGALDVWTCAVHADARLRATGLRYDDGGLCFSLHEEGVPAPAEVRTGLIGDYNVANLLAVIGGLRALGVALADAATVCARLTPVPGRLQRVEIGTPVPEHRNQALHGAEPGLRRHGGAVDVSSPGAGHRDRPREAAAPGLGRPGTAARVDADGLPEVVVDYAHTPDALDKALQALQPLAAARGGVLWCVFGCGGNRDGAKRPLMGALAQRLARHVVVTSDNPRGEAPAGIIAAIVAGMVDGAAPTVIEDRRAAVAHAVSQAAARDVVLIAGKGHEDYQEVAGVKHPFDDAVEAAIALRTRVSLPGARA